MYSNAPTADANVANNFYLKVPELSKTMVKNSFLKKTKMTCDSRDLIYKSFVEHANIVHWQNLDWRSQIQ